MTMTGRPGGSLKDSGFYGYFLSIVGRLPSLPHTFPNRISLLHSCCSLAPCKALKVFWASGDQWYAHPKIPGMSCWLRGWDTSPRT